MPTSDYTPSVVQVARKNLQRTRDRYGALAGTFTPNTLPTDTQATALITDVITEVADVIGDDIPPAYFDDAQEVVSLLAAAQIELDFYSEQVNTGRSIYPQLIERYKSALDALSKSIAGDDPNTPGVDPTAVATRASFGFPPDSFFTRDKVW